MVSELFFYILCQKVERKFERIPLTHTVTHTPIAYSGQSGTKDHLLAVKPQKSDSLLKIFLVKYSTLKLCKSNRNSLGLFADSPRELIVSCVLLVAVTW